MISCHSVTTMGSADRWQNSDYNHTDCSAQANLKEKQWLTSCHISVLRNDTFHKVVTAYIVSHCRLVSSLHTSSLCWHFGIVSLCAWSLYSSACQSREKMFPLKVIKSDKGSLQGEQTWPWEALDTVRSLRRRFLSTCLSLRSSLPQLPALTYVGGV